MYREDDTIAAISTAPGQGGIGIVRISGSDAVGVAHRIFHPKSIKVGEKLESHRIYYGRVVNPENGRVADEALLTYMRGPKSYTREDVVEINCHGGPAALRTVLELALHAGARPAEPGEFTRRAFMSGRIDLTQAEAVMDVIASKTGLALGAAMEQLGGGLRKKMEPIRDGLMRLLALTEVSIDFPEEDIEYVPVEGLKAEAGRLLEMTSRLLATYEEGRVLREGLRLAITGGPNVGKSSLLNLLAGTDRAIVTEIPGTTRDTVEEHINVGGLPVRVIDTAGIRKSRDIVEKEGIRRSKEAADSADVILLVLDGSRELGEDDKALLFFWGKRKEAKENREVIPVINKSDLGVRADAKAIIEGALKAEAVEMSARTGDGLAQLTARVRESALSGGLARASGAAINLRHKLELETAGRALGRFVEGCAAGLSPEFLALELREAVAAVGRVTGDTTPEDVLERIFGGFCIGK